MLAKLTQQPIEVAAARIGRPFWTVRSLLWRAGFHTRTAGGRWQYYLTPHGAKVAGLSTGDLIKTGATLNPNGTWSAEPRPQLNFGN